MKLMSVVRVVPLLCVTAVTVVFGNGTPRGSFEEAKEKPHYTSFEEQKTQSDAEKRQADLTRKLEEEQKKRDEASVRERVINEEKKKQEAELKAKFEPEDPKKVARDVLAQFLTVYKHYEAGGEKEGKVVDALLAEIDAKGLLEKIPAEQLKSIILSLEPKPDMRLMLLKQLTDVAALHGKAFAQRPGLRHFMVEVLSSLTVDDFKTLLVDEGFSQTFQKIAEQLQPMVQEPAHIQPLPAEALFYRMIDVAKIMVDLLGEKKIPEKQLKIFNDSLLGWISHIPVEKSASRNLLHAVLEGLPIGSLIEDLRFVALKAKSKEALEEYYNSVRSWLIVLKGFDEGALHGVKMSLLEMAQEQNFLGILRDALLVAAPLPTDPKDPLFPLTVDVKNAYLAAMAKGLRAMLKDDQHLIADALFVLNKLQPKVVSEALGSMLRNLPGIIKTVDAEAQGKDLTPLRKKELQERIALLKVLNEQLPSFVLPEHNLPADVWKNVITRVNAGGKAFKPAFLSWEPERRDAYLFTIDSSKPFDRYNSLKRFVEVYNFYSEFSGAQKALLAEAKKHYTGILSLSLSPQEKQALLEKVALDPAVQKFLNATAGANGFFGYRTADGFKNDMLKLALERIRLGDRRALLGIVPTLIDMRSLVTLLLSDKANHEILYSVLSGMADNRYAQFLADITQDRFKSELLPVIFNARLYLDSPRVKQLIDTMRAYKKTFENAQQAKPKNQRIVFPIDDKEFKQAVALYEDTLKNEEEHAKKEREATGL